MRRGWRHVACVLACVAAGSAQAASCKVAVDVGHFLEQPGALSARGIPEFQFNVALARRIRDALLEQACEVVLIGEDGRMRNLRDRTAAAEGVDLFLSVHHDSVKAQYLDEWTVEGVTRYYADDFAGFSLFVSHDNLDLERSMACAASIGAQLRSAGYTPSLYHADPIRGEDRPFADRSNGVHYYDQLVVLRTATQAAVLLEAGVIVNRNEELVLSLPQTRDAIARAVAIAVRSCLT